MRRRDLPPTHLIGLLTIEYLTVSTLVFAKALLLEHARVSLLATFYKDKAQEIGLALCELVGIWHQEESRRRDIELSKSTYLVLSYNDAGWYQIHQFKLNLFDPTQLRWYFPTRILKGVPVIASGLRGEDRVGKLVEWYRGSGAQLKFYPHEQDAIWKSERFQLEPLPDREYGMIAKAAAYFPEQWAKACRETTDNAVL